ncbi:MAG: hypothetical protein QM779_15790 [Propionicimonas sp.]|uniref:hypothetical protein n=1 Tax=Propionicimonas sp. TaxID=1955623 RepID=UPI003D106585
MARLNFALSGGAGLTEPVARVAMVLMWAAGCVGEAVITERFAVSGWLGVIAYLLPLGAAITITAPHVPLRRTELVVVLVCTIVPIALAVAQMTRAEDHGLVNICCYYLVLLMPRGHPVVGGAGGGAVIAGMLTWGAVTGRPPADLFELLLMPVTALVAASACSVLLASIVRRVRRAIGTADAAQLEVEAASVAEVEYRRRMAELADQVRPVLTQLADGEPLTPDLHRHLAVVEGDVRDRLRAAELRHPALAAAVARSRARGVSVLLLGRRGELPAEPLADGVVRHLIDALDQPDLRSATIRAVPPGRPGVVTAVLETARGVERVELDAQGRPLASPPGPAEPSARA